MPGGREQRGAFRPGQGSTQQRQESLLLGHGDHRPLSLPSARPPPPTATAALGDPWTWVPATPGELGTPARPSCGAGRPGPRQGLTALSHSTQ